MARKIFAGVALTILLATVAHAADSCPSTAVSCTTNPTTGAAWPTCCVPDNGLLLFVQTWLPGACQKTSNACVSATLTTAPNEFTIHGLWPDYCNGTYPSSSCDTSRDLTDVQTRLKTSASSSLVTNLNKYWLAFNGNQNTFWSHEWSKHGTCFSNLKPSCIANYQTNDDLVLFFQTAFAQRANVPLSSAFKSAGIVPSATTSYTLAQFEAALKSAFGYTGNVQCVTGSDGRYYLSEVQIFMRAVSGFTLKLGAPVAQKSSCPASTAIYYPTSASALELLSL